MENKLVKQSNALSVTAPRSSQDLVLVRMLDLAAQMFQRELMPGESRVWQETFKKSRPELIEAAFVEYFRGGKFFPKPADIIDLMGQVADAANQIHEPIDKNALAAEQSTPEYQALVAEFKDKWKRWGGIVRMPGGEGAKKPRPTFRSALASEEPASSGGDDFESGDYR